MHHSYGGADTANVPIFLNIYADWKLYVIMKNKDVLKAHSRVWENFSQLKAL